MDTVISALLAADERTATQGSQGVHSNTALLSHNQKIVKFSTLCLARPRSTRNTKATVNCLPNELLLAVFRILSAAGPVSAFLRATNVCNRWRALALSDSSLWTEIHCSYPEPLVELLLQRSRNAPLSLSCDSDYNIDLPVVQTMLKRNTQIGYLSIKHSYDVATVLRVFAPLLSNTENLSLDRCSDVSSSLDSDPPPNLRDLAARRCQWLVLPPLIRSLQCLELNDINYLPFDDLLDALDACPALEALLLRNCLPRLPQRDTEGRVVALPKLTKLQVIDDSRKALGFLLAHLALPADAYVHIEADCNRFEPLPLRRTLFPVPYIFLKDPSLWPPLDNAQSLALGFHPDCIVLNLTPDAQRSKNFVFQGVLNIGAYLPPAVALLPEVLDICLTSAIAPGLLALDVYGDPTGSPPGHLRHKAYCEAAERFPLDLWPRIFASLPNLEMLGVHCVQDITALADALGSAAGDALVPAPALKGLRVRCSLNASARSALLRALSYRDSLGARMEVLMLLPPRETEGSTLPDDFVDDIQKLVGTLTLGFENGYKKESDVTTSVEPSESTAAVVEDAQNEAE